MRISTAIQHHPSRADKLPELVGGLAPLEVDVVADPFPDDPTPATWRTYRRALEETPVDATHRLVIQDDAEPCAGFAEVVERVVERRPNVPVVLCVCGEPAEAAFDVRVAAARGEPFVELVRTRWVPAVAVVWPVEIATEVLGYVARASWPVDFRADDEILFRACRGLGVVPVACVPSIVEHPNTVPSVSRRWPAAGASTPARVAAVYDPDPRERSWDDPPPRLAGRSLAARP